MLSMKQVITISSLILKEDNLENNIERKPEELAYLAGYIDADGYIGLKLRDNRKWYRPALVICASRLDILEELRDIAACGGHFWTGKRNEDSKRLHSQLEYVDQQACKVCELVQPYLRLKGAQAALIIQVGAFRRKHPNGKGFNYNAYYIPRYEEIRRLNEGNKSEKIR